MSGYDNITVAECLALNEALGMTVEVNDGQVTGVNFEEAE